MQIYARNKQHFFGDRFWYLWLVTRKLKYSRMRKLLVTSLCASYIFVFFTLWWIRILRRCTVMMKADWRMCMCIFVSLRIQSRVDVIELNEHPRSGRKLRSFGGGAGRAQYVRTSQSHNSHVRTACIYEICESGNGNKSISDAHNTRRVLFHVFQLVRWRYLQFRINIHTSNVY